MPNHNPQPPGTQSAEAIGYEKRDANAKGIFLCVLGLFVVLVFADFVVHWIIKGFRNSPPASDYFTGSVRAQQAQAANAPYPRLQISPSIDLKDFREREIAQLNTYGWVNQTAGVVRVPIERAIELVLQKGLPTRQNGHAGKAGPSTYEMQLQRPNTSQQETGGNP
jgi:hypothetical protein